MPSATATASRLRRQRCARRLALGLRTQHRTCRTVLEDLAVKDKTRADYRRRARKFLLSLDGRVRQLKQVVAP